jgi:hypothetical protein
MWYAGRRGKLLLLKNQRSENKVIGKVPVLLGFERLVVLIYAAAICESDADMCTELGFVSYLLFYENK